jgi:hypothetical protein
MKNLKTYIEEKQKIKYAYLTIQPTFTYEALPEGIRYKYTLCYIKENVHVYINTYDEVLKDYNEFIKVTTERVFKDLEEDESLYEGIIFKDILF